MVIPKTINGLQRPCYQMLWNSRLILLIFLFLLKRESNIVAHALIKLFLPFPLHSSVILTSSLLMFKKLGRETFCLCILFLRLVNEMECLFIKISVKSFKAVFLFNFLFFWLEGGGVHVAVQMLSNLSSHIMYLDIVSTKLNKYSHCKCRFQV